MTAALLLDEPCLVIQPALVRALGHLSDAAVLQQMHYWQSRATAEHAGHRWIYKTYDEWSAEIGITSKQVRSSIGRLETAGLVESCQPEAYHRRKWYRVRYESPILNSVGSDLTGTSTRPNGQIQAPKWADGTAQTGASITETTTENTTETTNTSLPSSTTEIEKFDSETRERLEQCQRLAEILADRIEQNGAKRPTITKAWVRTFDRMIRLDGRSVEQIERAIEWATSHTFWSTNILSPDALRRHYDRMSLQARRDASAQGPRGMAGVREFLATLND